jgi:hypothetical protein
MLPLLPNLCVAFQPNGQWTLANGTSASFVFLDPAYKAAWRPDGSAANLDTLIRNLGPSYVDAIEQATSPILIVWTRAPAIEPMPPTVRFKFPSTSQIGASFVTLARDKKSYISGGPFLDRQPTQQDVAIGIADGGWTAAGSLTFEPHRNGIRQSGRNGVAFKVSFKSDRTNPTGDTEMSIQPTDLLSDQDIRFVIRDGQDVEIPSHVVNRLPSSRDDLRYRIEGNLKRIASVQLQSRPFEWHTILAAHFHGNLDHPELTRHFGP